MSRPRTPTNVLDMRGAFKTHPERAAARANEPVVVDPVGEPPARCPADIAEAWRELAGQAPAGVLTAADRVALEMAALLLVKFRASPLTFTAAEFGRLQSILASFGMTPADRSRVGVANKPASTNPFEALKKPPAK